jgi:hypothetical protein
MITQAKSWIVSIFSKKKKTYTAKEIIMENLFLGRDKEIPIIEMIDKQEILIEKYIELGYTKGQFFEHSREYFKAIKTFVENQK